MSEDGKILTGEAKALLNNETLTAAFDMQRAALIRAAMATKPRDDEERYKYLMAASVVDGVRAHLAAIINAQDAADKAAEADAVQDYYARKAKERWNAASVDAMRSNAA